jgi:hypothetical protein
MYKLFLTISCHYVIGNSPVVPQPGVVGSNYLVALCEQRCQLALPASLSHRASNKNLSANASTTTIKIKQDLISTIVH